MNLKPKIDLSTKTLVRLIKAAVAVIVVVTLTWVGLFLKDQFYQPLNDAYAVAQLKTKVTVVNLEKNKLEQVLQALKTSAQPLSPSVNSLRNIFGRPSTPPADPPPQPISPPETTSGVAPVQ
jgi:hypothetical protein